MQKWWLNQQDVLDRCRASRNPLSVAKQTGAIYPDAVLSLPHGETHWLNKERERERLKEKKNTSLYLTRFISCHCLKKIYIMCSIRHKKRRRRTKQDYTYYLQDLYDIKRKKKNETWDEPTRKLVREPFLSFFCRFRFLFLFPPLFS